MAVARGRAPVPPCRPRACSVPPRCRPVHAPRRFFPLSAVPSSSHGSQRFDRPASSAMEMVQRARRRCWSVDQPSCSSSVHHTRALPVPRLLSRPARLASPGQAAAYRNLTRVRLRRTGGTRPQLFPDQWRTDRGAQVATSSDAGDRARPTASLRQIATNLLLGYAESPSNLAGSWSTLTTQSVGELLYPWLSSWALGP
jgi:hypothetical protein